MSSKNVSIFNATATNFPSHFWEHILGSLAEGILVIDSDQRVVFVNAAAETLTGLARMQVWARPYEEALSSNPWLVSIIHRTFSSGLSPTAGEGMLRTRSPRATPVRLTCSPIVTGEGTCLGVVAVLHNMTHQKELVQEEQQSLQLAQMGIIAAGLAHEIRNPLAGIRGATQLLQGRIHNDPSALEYTTVMIREIDRLNSLLEQILRLSPNAQVLRQPMNVHKVLTDVLLLETKAAPKGVKIHTQFDPSLPEILGDEAQLTQVFKNVIRNGLQALQGIRGGELTIATRMATDFHIRRTAPRLAAAIEPGVFLAPSRGRRQKQKAQATITETDQEPSPSARMARFLSVDVTDNGPGIDPEHLSQLFTPFFTTKSGGTGLGLAISQRIIAQHGGMIRVNTVRGYGTTFHINLPVAA
ncbi:MAG: nitrogen regulation protein NR(II) [Candidatus Binatia bacterium]